MKIHIKDIKVESYCPVHLTLWREVTYIALMATFMTSYKILSPVFLIQGEGRHTFGRLLLPSTFIGWILGFPPLRPQKPTTKGGEATHRR